MSRSAYTRRTCPICKKELSSNGLAWSSHQRTHQKSFSTLEGKNEAAQKLKLQADTTGELDGQNPKQN